MNKEKNVTGLRIRDIRTSLGLTGEEFGKKLNVTKTAVSYWENGTRKPDSDIINKLADLGNVSTDWLLGRDSKLNMHVNEIQAKPDMKLIERLKQERLNLNLNQPELATKMNVSKQAVSNWENGNRTPDIETLSSLADLFDCSVDYLLGRTDEKKAILCEYDIDGKNIIMAVSKDVYPKGLSKEEVIEKLKIVKRMEEMGIQFPTTNIEHD